MFGRVLFVGEIIWLLYYAAVTTSTYIVINEGGTVARSMRQDVFALHTHAATGAAVATILFSGFGPAWLLLVFAVEIFKDALNLVNIAWYTELKTANYALWGSALGVSVYGLLLSAVAFVWFVFTVTRKNENAKRGRRR